MKQTIPADDEHIRPRGVGDATVEAVGKVSEALERIERARGRLYDFHQEIGTADKTMNEAAALLDKAGHPEQARLLRDQIIGRNVIPGHWTFQIVEAFDDTYYSPAKNAERSVRDELMDGRRHIYESEMKEATRSKGQPGHEARP